MINPVINKQHQEIKQIIRELREDIYEESEVSANSLWIALKIGTLNGIMQMHLKYEDDYLYPALLNDKENEKLSVIVSKFVEEMGDLAQVFKDYQQKYLRHPEDIKQNTKEFINDTKQILDAIAARVDGEEEELFKTIV